MTDRSINAINCPPPSLFSHSPEVSLCLWVHDVESRDFLHLRRWGLRGGRRRREAVFTRRSFSTHAEHKEDLGVRRDLGRGDNSSKIPGQGSQNGKTLKGTLF